VRREATRVAGWYDDETDAALLRYWDGAKWSPHTAPRPLESPDAADTVTAEGTTLRLPPRSADEHTTVPLPPDA
jgi:hypothetical protein